MVVPQAEIVQVATGSQVSLVCNAEAWPRPTVKWEKDGKEIFDSAKYAMVKIFLVHFHKIRFSKPFLSPDDYKLRFFGFPTFSSVFFNLTFF